MGTAREGSGGDKGATWSSYAGRQRAVKMTTDKAPAETPVRPEEFGSSSAQKLLDKPS